MVLNEILENINKSHNKFSHSSKIIKNLLKLEPFQILD